MQFSLVLSAELNRTKFRLMAYTSHPGVLTSIFRKSCLAGLEDRNKLEDFSTAGADFSSVGEDLSKCRNDSVRSTDSGIGDWEEEVDPETGLKVVSLEEVSLHCSREDGWMVIYDKVYEVTQFMKEHPGGEEVMMEYLGYDETMAFRGVGHSNDAFIILENCCIGILPRNERLGFIV